MKKGSVFVAAVLALLTGCADDPSFTSTTASKPSQYKTVAICYNGLNTTRAALEAMALERCPVGTRYVQVHDHDTFWNNCPISKKTRVILACIP